MSHKITSKQRPGQGLTSFRQYLKSPALHILDGDAHRHGDTPRLTAHIRYIPLAHPRIVGLSLHTGSNASITNPTTSHNEH